MKTIHLIWRSCRFLSSLQPLKTLPGFRRIYPACKSPRSEQEAMAEEAEEEEEDSTQQLSKKFNCGRWNFS